MRPLLLAAGVVLALFGAMHLFVTWEHFRNPPGGTWSVLLPLFIAVASAAIAALAFRRALSASRRPRGTGGEPPPTAAG